MHLKNVELFCEVAKLRSFSRAAEAQNVSQSAASQTVHLLEKRLGTALIDRSIRPLELTAEGVVFFEGCQKLLKGFRQLEDHVRKMENRVIGDVRVAAIYSVGLLLMDSTVKRFRQLYPEANLHLSYLHPDQVMESVASEKTDLGIISFPRDGGEMHCIPWQEQRLRLVFPPEHPFAEYEDAVPLTALNGESFVGFTSELRIRRKIDRWLKSEKISVNIVHEFDSIENIKRAVEIGSGVAILPEPTVQREVAAGSLRICPLQDVDWRRPLGIIHRRNRSLTTVADKFVELLHEDANAIPTNGKPPNSQNGRVETNLKT
ncbi:MAG: LysR family transcriptional regulator [Planctomycetes bacterium]|nr:LysR family transcriptional regulator [Planctomycetota bacterium]